MISGKLDPKTATLPRKARPLTESASGTINQESIVHPLLKIMQHALPQKFENQYAAFFSKCHAPWDVDLESRCDLNVALQLQSQSGPSPFENNPVCSVSARVLHLLLWRHAAQGGMKIQIWSC